MIPMMFSDAAEAKGREQKIELIEPQMQNARQCRPRRLSLIAAVGADLALGKDGDLVWHIREDLQHFKSLTLGHTVIMGRKTWESLPKRPLPGRRNIVVTTRADFAAEGAETAVSPEEAVAMCVGEDEPFVIGGASIYQTLMPYADTLHITAVDAECADADVRFPAIDPKVWEKTECSEAMTTGAGITFRFETYRRR